MMLGSCKATQSLKDYLWKEQKSLFLKVKPSGCNGREIVWDLQSSPPPKEGNTNIWHSTCIYKLLEEGLEIEVDYLDTPLFQGVHVNVLNKDKCGCGKSFN